MFKTSLEYPNFLQPVSSQKQMSFKRLMITLGIVLMDLLMIFANITESLSEGVPVLKPQNTKYSDIHFTEYDDHGVGVVTSVIHSI